MLDIISQITGIACTVAIIFYGILLSLHPGVEGQHGIMLIGIGLIMLHQRDQK